MPARQSSSASDSLFFRDLGPPDGGEGGRAATPALQRARLLDAITRAVAQKGYAAVTLADIVGLANVSRRTFYEHFDDKEACFLAAYETGAQILLGELTDLPGAGWRDRLAAGMHRFLETLAADPAFARTFLVEVVGGGPKATALRQQVHGRFAERLARLSARASKQERSVAPVGDFWLRALVGGISEVVERHIFEHGTDSLLELEAPLVQLAAAVIAGSRTPRGPRARR